MKKIIRLSLLMMLIPLLILNVHAEESSIDNDSTDNTIEVVQNNHTLEEIVSVIPEQYSLDNIEEDYFKTEEEQEESNAEIALRKELEKTWTENEMDTESYDISIENALEEDSIYSYKIRIRDNETKEEIEKTIKVNYSNTGSEVEEFENIPEEEVKFILYYDLFTSERIENQVSLEEYLESILEDESLTYYPDLTDWNATFFTLEYEGNIYVFQNGVLYKSFPAIEEYVPKISITEDVGEDYVLKVAEKRYAEITEETLPENDFYFKEDHTVYSKSTDINYGHIEIEYLKEEDKVNYEYLEGSNTTMSKNNPSLSVRVNGNNDKMVNILMNGVEVNPNYYTVEEETSKITFDETFLKSMNAGSYNLVVKFSDGDAKTTFTLKEEERVELPTNTYTNTYTYRPVRVVNTVTEETEEEVKEDTKEETKDLVLEESKEVSKDNEKDNSKKETTKEQPKEEEKKKFNFVPIIIVVIALVVGGLGFVLYKKSQEE